MSTLASAILDVLPWWLAAGLAGSLALRRAVAAAVPDPREAEEARNALCLGRRIAAEAEAEAATDAPRVRGRGVAR